MKTTTVSVFHWLPRILCILAILIISLFAADSFDPRLTFWQQMGSFFMHMLPSFALLTFLAIAWKREMIGGVIFTIIGIVMSPFIYQFNYNMNHSIWASLEVISMITFPFVVVGALFILSDRLKKMNIVA